MWLLGPLALVSNPLQRVITCFLFLFFYFYWNIADNVYNDNQKSWCLCQSWEHSRRSFVVNKNCCCIWGREERNFEVSLQSVIHIWSPWFVLFQSFVFIFLRASRYWTRLLQENDRFKFILSSWVSFLAEFLYWNMLGNVHHTTSFDAWILQLIQPHF